MSKTQASITMYPVGELGDCFLLRFSTGDKESNVLIDSGSFRNSGDSVVRMRAIANDIKGMLTVDGKTKSLDLIIGTHQHNDHLSNFVHSEDIFKEIGADQVWLSWLDDPEDEQAIQIANGERKLTKKLQLIDEKISSSLFMKETTAEHIKDILGFYGLANEIVGAAPVTPQLGLDNMRKLGKEVRYLEPGESHELPGVPEGKVKVHVLGPPRDNNLLFSNHPKKGESYDFRLMNALHEADGFISALDTHSSANIEEDDIFPFSKGDGKKLEKVSFLKESYYNRSERWREIDDDWLDQVERLALYLDAYTNNSSLVLAFELVESKKVLLFVGDAQTGNWLSWKNVVWKDPKISLNNLLKNTVVYKVGHHGSHNATLPELLEKMEHKELVAMIPVDANDPNITKTNGWKMPAANLYKKLKELTGNRILRMDGEYDTDIDPLARNAVSAWGTLQANLEFRSHADLLSEIVTYTVK